MRLDVTFGAVRPVSSWSHVLRDSHELVLLVPPPTHPALLEIDHYRPGAVTPTPHSHSRDSG